MTTADQPDRTLIKAAPAAYKSSAYKSIDASRQIKAARALRDANRACEAV
jgi:hypothetical protein